MKNSLHMTEDFLPYINKAWMKFVKLFANQSISVTLSHQGISLIFRHNGEVWQSGQRKLQDVFLLLQD